MCIFDWISAVEKAGLSSLNDSPLISIGVHGYAEDEFEIRN
jgi:hypothetical protein